ncbi:MAG: hypothetical protein IM516_07235 [Pseudanabaena sp. M158S2SP1A06QC]|jgi:hypothetical protein|nr:hypothetical protein [Pseudanabaena sp. M53BS1SP1A06MG]MCA6581058.1 hypothetical protein [Pseudanabaena sp. M34BS1SP1A06MG]MCA6593990.1 hypothetical protein [Pseudanabaena sp. M38BS1SP1A06MG]MCA6602724.1 hypothetical protein [Pseudanabaena sp. M57BS1SP1A06MG]MCA6611894.1 hypothetical protein [Pseudanabaena sp. M158S2SP1A06QC]
MLKRSSTIGRLLLVCTGAMIGLGVIEQINEVFAQSSNISNPSKVTRDKVNNSGSPRNKVVNSTSTKKQVTQSKTAQAKVPKAPAVSNRLPHTAKDLKDTQAELFASPIAFKPSSSISLPTQLDSNLADIAQSTKNVAQSGTTTSNSPDLLRQQLLIRPITTQTTNVLIKRIYTPSLNAGTPVGFGLETGDAFIGIFGSTAGRLRNTIDGSISMGTGLGDASKYLAVEGVFNINSIRNFGSNGSFDLKVHRIVYEDFYRQVGVALGWTNFANYGTNAGGTPSSVYGTATISQLTDPENLDSPKPLIATLGVGGGTYRKSTSNGGVGVFANLGYQFAPQWGASTAWSGQGLNFGVGFLPDPTVPLNITLTYSDVTNNSDAGNQLILGVSYGFNYTGRK